MKTLLIGMMYAGECQYEAAKASLALQDMTDYDVFYLENMPNQQAYETLYRRFMSEAANYQYFIKFDADFILRDQGVLSRLLAKFDRPEIGCISIDVDDWLSGFFISGLHVYKSGTRWEFKTGESLFVDYGELVPGEIVRHSGFDWVSHNPEPEPYQAFRFGIHRASKSLQPDRTLESRDMSQGVGQHTLLQSIARKYIAGDRHPARLWTMLGVEILYQANDRRIMDYAGVYVRMLFEQLSQKPVETYEPAIIASWQHEIETAKRWAHSFMNTRVL